MTGTGQRAASLGGGCRRSDVRAGATRAQRLDFGRVSTRPSRRGDALWLPAVLAAATVLVQISYPLLDGESLRTATVTVVLLFCLTSLAHAGLNLGAATAVRLLAVAGGAGLAAEAVGVRTGLPFGPYTYAGTLGPQVLGVPVVVPLAWTMMAYPCLLLGRRLTRGQDAGRTAAIAMVGGAALASWDLFLDPQLVAAGHWTFDDPTPALPGVPGIPLTNYAGWLLVAVVMVAVLDVALPGTDGLDRRALAVPSALLAWTWLGSTLANLAFFGRPAVAGWGFVAMGLTVGPYLLSLRRHDGDLAGTPTTRAAESVAS